MKATGIVRRLDNLGRIVIPVEMRRTLDIEDNAPLEILVEGDRILLQKYERTCLFCGADKDIKEYKGRCVCEQCIRDMAK